MEINNFSILKQTKHKNAYHSQEKDRETQEFSNKETVDTRNPSHPNRKNKMEGVNKSQLDPTKC